MVSIYEIEEMNFFVMSKIKHKFYSKNMLNLEDYTNQSGSVDFVIYEIE